MSRKTAGLLCGLGLAVSCQVPDPPLSLRRAVQQQLVECRGLEAVYFRDLQTGQGLQIGTRHVFHAASTMKVLVLMKLYRDITFGEYALTDAVPVEVTFPSAVGGEFRTAADAPAVEEAIGKTMTVRELIHWMIVASDNLATNVLIQLAGGAKAITEYARACGLEKTTVARFIMDVAAFETGLSSGTQPKEFGKLLEKMYRGQIIGSAEMLEVMSEVGPSWLGRELPPGTRIAHKTGAIAATRHDAGIVWVTPERAFVVCVFTADLKNDKAGEEAIAAVARVLYDYVAVQPPP